MLDFTAAVKVTRLSAISWIREREGTDMSKDKGRTGPLVTASAAFKFFHTAVVTVGFLLEIQIDSVNFSDADNMHDRQ